MSTIVIVSRVCFTFNRNRPSATAVVDDNESEGGRTVVAVTERVDLIAAVS